jgi:uncharacterized membrane protein YqjE
VTAGPTGGTPGTTDSGAHRVAPPDVGDTSVGELVSQVASDLSQLVRQEMELAKTELKNEAVKAGKGAGMLGGAALAGYFVLLFLSLTGMWALAEAMDTWLAALIIMVIWAIIAAVLFVVGRKRLQQVNPKPEQTIESVKEDVRWTKDQMH